jgi:hypothetical protein
MNKKTLEIWKRKLIELKEKRAKEPTPEIKELPPLPELEKEPSPTLLAEKLKAIKPAIDIIEKTGINLNQTIKALTISVKEKVELSKKKLIELKEKRVKKPLEIEELPPLPEFEKEPTPTLLAEKLEAIKEKLEFSKEKLIEFKEKKLPSKPLPEIEELPPLPEFEKEPTPTLLAQKLKTIQPAIDAIEKTRIRLNQTIKALRISIRERVGPWKKKLIELKEKRESLPEIEEIPPLPKFEKEPKPTLLAEKLEPITPIIEKIRVNVLSIKEKAVIKLEPLKKKLAELKEKRVKKPIPEIEEIPPLPEFEKEPTPTLLAEKIKLITGVIEKTKQSRASILFNEKLNVAKENIIDIKERIVKAEPLKYAVPLIILLLMFTTLFFLRPTISGYVIGSKEFSHSDDLNLVINNSGTYNWYLEHLGGLNSLRLNGSISKQGSATVYLEHDGKSYLIFDSSTLKEKGITTITGLAISDLNNDFNNENELINNENKSITIKLEGGGSKAINDIFKFNISSSFNWDVDYNKLCTRWDINDIRICHGSDDCCALIYGLESLGEWNSSLYLSYGRYGAGLENVVKAQVIYYDVNLSVPYSDIIYSDTSSSEANFEEVISFTDICIDTCLLPSFNATSYKLVFIIENATLKIDNIKYSVEKDINISRNAPELIKEFDNITLYKDEDLIIDLSTYFVDKDNDQLNYSSYKADNISIIIEDSIAKITPEYNFTGKRYIYFTASDSYYNATSNIFSINVIDKPFKPEDVNVSEESIKPKITINQPVKWIKVVNASNRVINLSINISSDALNVTVRDVKEDRIISDDKLKINDKGIIKNYSVYRAEKRIEQIEKIEDKLINKKVEITQEDPTAKQEITSINQELLTLKNEQNKLTGYVVAARSEKGIITRFFEWLFDVEITGYVVYEPTIEKEPNITSVIIEDIVKDIEIEYYTEAPISEEENITRGKRIIISSDVHYEDILAYTYLPIEAPRNAVHLYHLVNNTRQEVSIDKYDLNENSLIDYIEWIVPSLSNETYELIIEITGAEHLNETREFVADVYEYVNETDGITYTIPDGEYVRAYFERNLSFGYIIDIVVVNSTGSVEAYKNNSNVAIGRADNILEDKMYHITLNHTDSHSVFDLKSIGNITYDYIQDAETQKFYEDFDGDATGWIVVGDALDWTWKGNDVTHCINDGNADCIGGEDPANSRLIWNSAIDLSDCASGTARVYTARVWTDSDTDNVDYIYVGIAVGGGAWNDTNMTNGPSKIVSHELYLSDDYLVTNFNLSYYETADNNELQYVDGITVNCTLSVDETEPSFSANQTNASSTTYNGTVVQINMTITDASSNIDFYTLSHNDTAGGTWKNETLVDVSTSPINMVWNYSITNFPFTGGTFGWQVWANDTQGNPNASNIYTFTVAADTTEPSFSANKTNASSTTYNGTVVQLNLTITDDLAGVDFYRLMTNDTDDNTWVNETIVDASGSSSVSAIFNYSIHNFSTSGGTLGWRVWTNDTVGNVNLSGIYSLVVQATPDLIPPTYSNFKNNASGATKTNGVVNWSIDLADSGGTGGDLNFYFFAHNNSGTLRNVSNGTLSGTPAFVNKTITITQVRDNYICGQYWFNDTGGNVNQTNMSCFTVQNTAPTTPDVSYPANSKNYSSIPYINYSSSDADGDAISYTIYINGILNITTNVNVTQWNASDGYYNLTVTANDSSDFSANSSVRYFRLDTTEPSFSNNQTNASLMKIWKCYI